MLGGKSCKRTCFNSSIGIQCVRTTCGLWRTSYYLQVSIPQSEFSVFGLALDSYWQYRNGWFQFLNRNSVCSDGVKWYTSGWAWRLFQFLNRNSVCSDWHTHRRRGAFSDWFQFLNRNSVCSDFAAYGTHSIQHRQFQFLNRNSVCSDSQPDVYHLTSRTSFNSSIGIQCVRTPSPQVLAPLPGCFNSSIGIQCVRTCYSLLFVVS